MRSHAKASTTGSTQRQARGLGRFFRGVESTRGASLSSKGSSAPEARRTILPFALFGAILTALVVVVAPASATKTHLLKETFGSAAQPTFTTPRGIAIDQSSGDVLVMDAGSPASIKRYNPDGTADNFSALGANVIDGQGGADLTPQNGLGFSSSGESQIAVDNSGGATDGNIYVTQSFPSLINIFSNAGAYLGQLTAAGATNFSEACGVTVDSAGVVYVGDFGAGIEKFVPAANPPVNADHTATFTTTAGPCTLAAGAGATAGFLFPAQFSGPISKIDSGTGELKYTVASGSHRTVSVDPATGRIYAARFGGTGSEFVEYDASGAGSATQVSSSKPGSTVEGIAVRGSSGDIFISRSANNKLEVFDSTLNAFPDVVTTAATNNTGTKATLNGTVNPDGVELSECFFEYGKTSAYGSTVPCAETPAAIGTGTSPVAVHADISGLQPNGTNYNFRLVAKNPSATINGSNQSFTTPDTVITGAATGIADTEATLNGTVNPDGVAMTECVFEWGTTTAYGETAPCVPNAAGIGSGTSPVAVSANLSGLDVATVYHFRLKAANANGPILGKDKALQTKGPPIADQWSENVTFTQATLKAKINPAGKATSAHFEYGTSTSYGSETPSVAVGSDSSNHTLGALLEELQPDTTYHYRVIASNADAVNEGPDRTFTTYEQVAPETNCPNQSLRIGLSATLPDCRAYEMVSPIDKGGSDIFSFWSVDYNRTSFNQSSLDGNKITYTSSKAFGDQLGGQSASQYIAARGPSGWSTHGINLPRSKTIGSIGFFTTTGDVFNQFHMFSPDLSSAWVASSNREPLTPDASPGWVNIFRRDTSSENYEALTKDLPGSPSEQPEDHHPEVVSQSSDESHVLLHSTTPLTDDAVANDTIWQTYDYSDGDMHLVSVLPDGTVNPTSSSPGSNGYHETLFSANQFGGMVTHAISDDGSRIFWTAEPPFAAQGTGAIYVRKNPGEPQSALNGSDECTEPAKACTVLVAPGGGNRFWVASADGSRVIYQTGGIATSALKEFNVETEATVTIAGEPGGVVGASDDLSYVYFTSEEDLAAGAAAGEPNLYLSREGAISFIATLSPVDQGEELALEADVWGVNSIDSPESLSHVARVTPDGRHLAFQSVRSLTGYDNTDALSGKPAMEVYLYEADSDTLVCASCNPSGARPMGGELQAPYMPRFNHRKSRMGVSAAAWLQTWIHRNYHSHALSDDGSRLYFNAFDALVPADTNGLQDVYQWEAEGSGTCNEGGGCISLISTGQSAKRSEFIDADPDGSNIFIETSSSIDPRDPGLIDIYDARVNGGFALPPSLPECLGDACQGVPEPPRDPTPASASFRGAADPTPPKPRRSCKASNRRATKGNGQAKHKKAKRCRRANRRAGR